MSIDLRKVRKELASFHMTPVEFFCIERQCALIKCYLNPISEWLFIYIPSKLRVDMVAEKGDKVYHIEDEEETTENDDYSKTATIPDMDEVSEEQKDSQYAEHVRKYQKPISLEGTDEPVPRKIKRQTDRLRLPFARLSYDMGVQNGKWLCLSFGGENSVYSIKSYPHRTRSFCFVMILPDVVDKAESLVEQFGIIREQFYNIVHRAILSNLEALSSDLPAGIIRQIIAKRAEYIRLLQECGTLYTKAKEREDAIVAGYRDKMASADQGRRIAIEADQQRQFDSIHRSRRELVDRGIEVLNRFHYTMLIWEESSFDNMVMVARVKKNWERLKTVI